jgi:hypothetical protein
MPIRAMRLEQGIRHAVAAPWPRSRERRGARLHSSPPHGDAQAFGQAIGGHAAHQDAAVFRNFVGRIGIALRSAGKRTSRKLPTLG